MTLDRRSPRKPADRVIPLQIEPDISAIVLDSSEGGLRFRALRPMMLKGSIRFSFTYDGHPFEASGELVWIDSAKLMGGLSFASLPQVTCQRIRNWIASPTPDGNGSRPVDFAPPGSGQPSVSHVPPPSMAFPRDIGQGYVMLEDDRQYYENTRTKFFPGFLAGVVVSAIVAVMLLFVFDSSVGALLARWRAAYDSVPVSQAAIHAPPSAPVPSVDDTAGLPAASESLPSPPYSLDTGEAALLPTQPLPVTQPSATESPSLPPDSTAPAPADPGAAELALAQSYLDGRRGPPNSAAAVRFLWSAVEQGNVAAEITLAGLYARGDGVTKNCDQARILLRAAAERGSREASQQLAHVVRSGCR